MTHVALYATCAFACSCAILVYGACAVCTTGLSNSVDHDSSDNCFGDLDTIGFLGVQARHHDDALHACIKLQLVA